MNAGRRLAQVLASTRARAQSGTRLFELEEHVQQELSNAGLRAANGEVLGFRHAASFGLNSVIGGMQVLETQLKSGDLLTVDVAARDQVGGLVDAAVSFCVDEEAHVLPHAAEVATNAGISAIRPGASARDVLVAIEAVLPRNGITLAPLPFLHGIANSLHEEPFADPGDLSTALFEVGMVLAVEPVLLAAPSRLSWDVTGWEVSAAIGCATAFVEHTVAVTLTGAIILTEYDSDG